MTASVIDPPAPGMVWIPGGTFQMGSDHHYPEERPAHRVTVSGFWMDRHEVTNGEFARFVAATGYVTVAERPIDPAAFPGVEPALLRPGGLVFRRPAGRVDLRDWPRWWAYVPGASWRAPRGPGSGIGGMDDHPVVQVAYEDAEAYARWVGKEIPTEAEWERAARGGLEGAAYVWGEELTPDGRHLANTWQGDFPRRNLRLDGWEWTSPVDAFPPNGYGLLDMAGNVWELTADWYQDHHPADAAKPCCVPVNPRGPAQLRSYDPAQPHVRVPRRVIKGGSHLCAPNYCRRYRPAARSPQAVDTGTCHVGFRCVVRTGTQNGGPPAPPASPPSQG